jgi:methyl-accepting chemotaxis protein
VAASSRNLLYTLAALVLAFGVTCAWLLTTGITGPLQQAVAAARRVASGDLTGHIDDSAKDETGQLLSALKEMNAACWAS